MSEKCAEIRERPQLKCDEKKVLTCVDRLDGNCLESSSLNLQPLLLTFSPFGAKESQS